MNSHLSLEEIYQWLSEERGEEVEEHVRDCPACRAELDQLQNALTGFRTSLEQSPVPGISYSRVRHTLPRWILAAATLALLVATPVFWNARQQRAAEQAKADQLLLERVETGLSRAVPASMEPLLQLVSNEEKE
jgi:predicted anti-sigma-YlaC factor YlaD